MLGFRGWLWVREAARVVACRFLSHVAVTKGSLTLSLSFCFPIQEASAGAGFSASPSAHPDHLLPTCANVLHTGLYW